MNNNTSVLHTRPHIHEKKTFVWKYEDKAKDVEYCYANLGATPYNIEENITKFSLAETESTFFFIFPSLGGKIT